MTAGRDDDPLAPLGAALRAPDGGDLAARIEAGLAALPEGEGQEALGDVLRLILLRRAEEDLAHRVALQKSQAMLRHLRQAPPPQRLAGEARGLSALYAEALRALPEETAAQLFDADDYLARHPDVAQAGVGGLAHYLASGAAEGRRPGGLDAALSGLDEVGGPPATLPDLLARQRPRFLFECAPGLRTALLAQVGRRPPRVSVVLPTRDRAHILPRAVASALLQSVAPHEVIVVDDGSTDGTPEMLRARFPEALDEGRLRLVVQPPAGVAAARNAGLAAATGELVAYLDSDNSWEPDHLLAACSALAASPEHGAVYTATARHNLDAGWSDLLWARWDRAALVRENYIDLNCFVHHRSLTERLGGFDTGLTRLVDWELILRLTDGLPPLAVPLVTAHHVVAGPVLGNITAREPLGPNLARIRVRFGGEPRDGGADDEPR